MPSRNRIKSYHEEAYYHVYNRGVNKRKVFIDDEDYRTFLNLLKRYLDAEPQKDNKGRQYPWLHDDLELLAYCLMPNHFHLLFYQKDHDSLKRLMHAVCTSYTTYFNKKYKRVGPLFQDRFKAVEILSDKYLQHISRYIHLNPRNYIGYEWSSIGYYLGSKNAAWLKKDRILEIFVSQQEYRSFLADYEEYKMMLSEVKAESAEI